ncbi:MAG: tetratricopeptide repeat protein [Candidatus Liptonbacteria bacterium]|nr:tetratricopeptide repeat protein [Candidatus Liptonbacteria bacterium]
MTNYLLKTIKIFVFIAVIGTPLFYLKRAVYPFTLTKTAFFQGLVEITFFLWLALATIDKRYRPRKSLVLLGLAMFIGALVFTAITGADISRSFWSTQERNLGVITIIHLALFTLVLSSLWKEIPWKSLLYSSLTTSFIVSVIAFLQIINPNLLLNEQIGGRPGATFGNPTFLAGYLIFNIFLSLYFLLHLFEERVSGIRKRKFILEAVFLSLVFVLDILAVFRAQTRGDILGLLLGVFVLLFLFGLRPPKLKAKLLSERKFYLVLWLLAVVLTSAFWFTKSSSFWSGIPGLNRFQDISLSSSSLLPRIIALRAAWQGFLEKPLTGWGWENFNIVFNKHYDPRALEISYQETRFDKPHNALAEYFVSGGLILGLAYLALIGIFLYSIWRLRDKTLGNLLIAVLFAYFTRNLFVFETIGPFFMFFMILGFVHGKRLEKINAKADSKDSQDPPLKGGVQTFTLISSALVAIIAVYFLNIQTIIAVRHQYWGFVYFVRNEPTKAVENFHQGVELWTPYRSNFKRDYATTVAEAYFYGKLTSEDEVRRAVSTMEEVAAEHPKDFYNHQVLIDIYNQVSDVDPENFLKKAEREAEIALTLSPNRQEVYFSLSKTKFIEGKASEAFEILKHAIELNDKVPDAHFYYGLLAFENHELEIGYQEIKKALALGRRWKRYHEPRVVGNYFADAGHLPEAIELYNTALELEPSDLDAKMNLGIAYFLVGERELARSSILEVSRNFDLKQSPRYQDIKEILDELGIKL